MEGTGLMWPIHLSVRMCISSHPPTHKSLFPPRRLSHEICRPQQLYLPVARSGGCVSAVFCHRLDLRERFRQPRAPSPGRLLDGGAGLRQQVADTAAAIVFPSTATAGGPRVKRTTVDTAGTAAAA